MLQQPLTWVAGDRRGSLVPLGPMAKTGPGHWSLNYPKQFRHVGPRKCQAPPELLQRVTPEAWSGVSSAEVDCVWGSCWGTACSDHEFL
jgi:hypothetical protein